jgi:hypothetical protein
VECGVHLGAATDPNYHGGAGVSRRGESRFSRVSRVSRVSRESGTIPSSVLRKDCGKIPSSVRQNERGRRD